MKVSYGSLRKRDAARCAELETQLFEGDDPWPEIAFRTVRTTLEHYFADRRSGRFQVHAGDIS